tara:strand:- start:316772 stop:316993 length:222 start_codon:yes stop_codon:yes gene_type:complete
MSLEQHNETTLTQIIRIRNMTAAGQTFGTCARNGIAVTAFGLGATGAKQLGNFPLTDQSPTISLGADTPVCSR